LAAERDDDGKLVQYRGLAASVGCKDCPCSKNGQPPLKPVRGFGATGGLAIVGEGPGSEEMFQGYPFIGPSGRVVTQIFQRNHIDRQLMWITNALLCPRPKDDVQFSVAVGCCRPRLVEELQFIKPTTVLALGGTAVKALQLPVHGILDTRGTVQATPFLPGTPAFATIHPAALFKGGAGETGGGKQKQNVDAQHMFLEADIVKAHHVSTGALEGTWSDDIDVFVDPGPLVEGAPEGPVDPLAGFDRAFLGFHEGHPEVYAIVVEIIRELADPGFPLHDRATLSVIWSTVLFRVGRELKIALPNIYQPSYFKLVPIQTPELAAFLGKLR
jgi:DNA polymerase